jgi:hypothetical protein
MPKAESCARILALQLFGMIYRRSHLALSGHKLQRLRSECRVNLLIWASMLTINRDYCSFCRYIAKSTLGDLGEARVFDLDEAVGTIERGV